MTPASHASENESADPQLRLQKYLAAAGLGSRRQCEEFILAGRVTVDGKTVSELGRRIDPEQQKVRMDGELVRVQTKRYYLLNKPAGYLCTNLDPSGRPRVIDLIPNQAQRLFTVGRLDENSEGLILLTNDGELANRLAHPRYEVRRKYRVQVAGKPNWDTLKELKKGVHFEDGFFRVQGIRRMQTRGKSSFLEIELTQGRNREIRRLLARAGHKVMHLQRIAFGPLKLGRVPLGKYRRLTDTELKSLRKLLDKPDDKPKKQTTRKKRKRPAPRK